MSVIETRQHALDGKMAEVIVTTEANTKALQELKLVFTKYMSRFKDTSDVSPSMSKSTIDSDAALLAEGVQPSAPTNPPSSKDAAHCAMDTLDFDTEEFIPSEGKREPGTKLVCERGAGSGEKESREQGLLSEIPK
jgi:hypothetical protein